MSDIIIIDKFDPPAPKWVYKPPPTFKTELDEKKYWAKQYQRWSEGYAGLTGPHYFYLQQIHLKTIDGDIIRPSWRDVDDFIFEKIDYCRKNARGLLVYKRREVGATSIFVGGLPAWFMRMYPGATINLTSKDQDGIFRMFEDKVITMYEHMDKRILNPIPTRINQTKQSVYLKLELKKIMEDGSVQSRYSELNLKETSEKPDSPNNFSSSRAIYTYVDEAPLHKRIKVLLRSMDATMRKGTERKGFFAMAGTVEEKLTAEELAGFYQLINDAEALNIEACLIPAWMGLEQFSVNGWSDKEKGTEWVMAERERLAKVEDRAYLNAFKRNYPLTEDDIFDLGQGAMFEEDVAETLSATLKKLIEEGSPEAPYKLSNLNGNIEYRPHSDGKVHIIEPPKQGLIYYLTLDGIASGTEDGAEAGSELACIIFKGFDPEGRSFEPVCVYKERPKRIEEAYVTVRNMFLLYNAYNGFKVQKGIYYETNAGTGSGFANFLMNHGLAAYKGKRIDVSGKGNIDTKKDGQAVDKYVQAFQINKANIFLRRYGWAIRSKLLLRDLLKAKEVNADLRSAFFMLMIAIPDFDKPIEKKKKVGYRTLYTTVINGNGEIVWGEKRIPLSGVSDTTNHQSAERLDQFTSEMMQQYGRYWFQSMNKEQRDKYKALAIQATS